MIRTLFILIFVLLTLPAGYAISGHWIKIADPTGDIAFIEAEFIKDNFYISSENFCSKIIKSKSFNSASNEIYSDSIKIIFVPGSVFSAIIKEKHTDIIQLSSKPVLKDNELYLPLKDILKMFTNLSIIDAELINDNVLLYKNPALAFYDRIESETINHKEEIPIENRDIPNSYKLPSNLIRKNIIKF